MHHHIAFLLFVSAPCLLTAQEQHQHGTKDTTIYIQEVLVQNRQGVSSSYQREQRASKQLSTDKILDHVPEVQMIRRGNYAWEPTIRSLNSGQINVTIDGMHIFGACTDKMDPVSSYIEPTNLAQLSVNVGADGANYGGGIGGGIDFKLTGATPGAPHQLQRMLGTGYESNGNAVQTLAALQYSTPKFALQGNGIFRKSGAYQAANRVEIPYSQFQKWNAALSAAYQISRSHTLRADYLVDRGRDIGYPALTMDVAYADADITSLTHHYHREDGLISHVKTKLYYNHIDHAMDDTKRPAEQVAMHMDMPGKSWTAGFYSELASHLEKHRFQGRLSGYVNRLTADMTMYPDGGTPMFMYTIPNAQRIFLATDLSHSWHLHPDWTIESNTTWSLIQSDLYNQSGKDQLSGIINGPTDRSNMLWNIRSGAHWRPTSQWQFKIQVGRTSRAATLQEYYGFYIYDRLDGFDYLGNNQLHDENAWQVDFGAVYDDAWIRAEANAFRYGFSDYIVGRMAADYQTMTIGANGVKQYTNIPSASLYGGELSLRFRLHKNLTLHSANACTVGKDDEGYALPLIAPFRSMNSLHLTVAGINGSLETEYNAAQNRVSETRYGETGTPASTLFHIGARRTFSLQNKVFTASLRVENLFDQHYYRHLDIMKVARPGRNFITQITMVL